MTETEAWCELLTLSISVPDARSDRGKRYNLAELLFLIVAGLLAGGQDAEDIIDFGEDHIDWLEQFLLLPHGLPSHDTVLRIVGLLQPGAVESLVRSWTEALARPGALTTEGFQVAFDGKAARGSADRRAGLSPVHMVSAFLTEAGFTLGSERVDDKSNEIKAIPILVRSLDLRGATVSSDAMGCQREIAACLREAGAHYLLQVKGNQPTLLAQIRDIAEELARRLGPGEERPVFDRHRDVDKGHCRIETRVCLVTQDLERIERRSEWADLAGVAIMLREREDVISGKRTREFSYFILSDESASARKVAGQIRAHWSIEPPASTRSGETGSEPKASPPGRDSGGARNTLHWSLDVVWGEDAHQVRHRQAAENFSWLRRFAAGLIKQSVGARMSGKRLRGHCNRNPKTILRVLAGEEVSRAAKRRPNRKLVGRFGQGVTKAGPAKPTD